MTPPLDGNLFPLNQVLTWASSGFQCMLLVLSLGQCSCSWWYVITQGLRVLRQVDQRRNHVPALQSFEGICHANPDVLIIRVLDAAMISVALIGFLLSVVLFQDSLMSLIG